MEAVALEKVFYNEAVQSTLFTERIRIQEALEEFSSRNCLLLSLEPFSISDVNDCCHYAYIGSFLSV